MQYLYRALNAFDMEIEPFKNGLISKKMISPSLENFYNLCFFHTKRIEEIFGGYENVTKDTYNSIYESIKPTFVKGVLPLIVSNAYDKQKYIDSIIEKLVIEAKTYAFMEIISTIQTHLCKGSSLDTEWISFSKSLEAIKKFYLTQEKHEVAVIKSNIDSVFDFSKWPPAIAFDISSREKIENNNLLVNKQNGYHNYTLTSKKARGFNYAVGAEEVLYYSLVPKEQIIALLKPLEVDLLLNNALDLNFYAERREQINMFYQSLLFKLEKELIDTKMQYVLEEHFKNQKPISHLSTSKKEQEELYDVKKKILAKTFSLDSRLIKKPTTNEIKIMEKI